MAKKNKFIFIIINCIGVLLHINYEINSSLLIFIFFSLTFNFYVLLNFHQKSSYFNLFLSIFLWLGFYFKFLSVEIFLNGIYPEIADYTVVSFEDKNYALLNSALFCWALIFSLSFNNTIFNYKINKFALSEKFKFNLDRYYVHIISIVLFSVILMALINYIFQIHQKGINIYDPEILYFAPIFKSVLIFGFSSLICLIIFLYNHSSKKIFFLYLFILENFFSSISSLSRGMIFNSFSLLSTFFYSNTQKLGFKVQFKNIMSLFIFILFLFSTSVIIVEKLRTHKGFYPHKTFDLPINESKKIFEINVKQNFEYYYGKTNIFVNDKFEIFTQILLKRFVGIDAMINLAVNKELLSFNYFYNSLDKKYNYKVDDDYKDLDPIQLNDLFLLESNNNYDIVAVKTPGIFAFLFYSGSLTFVFIALFSISSFFYHFEKILLKLNFNNIYLCSLITQLIAYRLCHFGLNPISSLMFFVPIIFIVLSFYIFLNSINIFKYNDSIE